MKNEDVSNEYDRAYFAASFLAIVLGKHRGCSYTPATGFLTVTPSENWPTSSASTPRT
jgi:hypothetical protein